MMVLYDMEGVANPPKYPVRVVLNNKTLSIFGAENIESVYKSFDLSSLVLKKYDQPGQNQNECFNLVDQKDYKHKQTICVFPASVEEHQSLEQARDQWIKDIHVFRDKCWEKPQFKHLEQDPSVQYKLLAIQREEQQKAVEEIEKHDAEGRNQAMEA